MYIRVPVSINHTLGEPASSIEGGLIGSLTGLGQAPSLPNLSDWKELISFRPPTAIQQNIKSRIWGFHAIEKPGAIGPINLDYYPVEVSQLPLLGGVRSTPEQFLKHIRLNINNFLDPTLTRFYPYDQIEAVKWASPNPLGAVLHLDFREHSVNVDDGSVVVADFRPDRWIVSTIWNLTDGFHPLCGNREWGYTKTGSGTYIYYTKAGDRLTDRPYLTTLMRAAVVLGKNVIYKSQRKFWTGFQKGISDFVNNPVQGGKAQALPPSETRYDWGQVAAQYHRPTINWI
ncbi:MAG TPA: hypothetical protein VK901_07265 [Nitrospiraceae bacterium]|nr:hypothetical protein [Nitrospiraceae bacterium]